MFTLSEVGTHERGFYRVFYFKVVDSIMKSGLICRTSRRLFFLEGENLLSCLRSLRLTLTKKNHLVI